MDLVRQGQGGWSRIGFDEERVALELGVDIGREIQVRELKQLDRLQELRRHDQGLALA